VPAIDESVQRATSDDGVEIAVLAAEEDAAVRALLIDLALDEQERYRHPRQSREQIDRGMPPLRARFTGENCVLVARDRQGSALGVCWCVLFDPGTGLEGEVAELYVRPDARGRGLATRLLRAAMALFRERGVTFACVWTRDDNPAAMAAYRAAGFTPTEQTVLTWLPVSR
jgi:ribosomal protein S18 acetylase RimI-like enzyme